MKEELVPFEEKSYFEDNFIRKGIFIDGELFDWGIDEDEYNSAVEWANNQPDKEKCLALIHANIEGHFLESLSEFVGRKITIEELKEARKTGWIKR